MRIISSTTPVAHFNLMRWFSLTALLSVALVSALAAWQFSRFLAERMIRQESEITAGFVRSIVAKDNAYAYFDASTAMQTKFQDFLDHMTHMPGVLRTNVYDADRRMIWSSDPSLIGQRFADNDELEEALRADLVIHSGIIDPAHLPKTEHRHLGGSRQRFVESYVPIFDAQGRQVVGVIELYKVPTELFEAIDQGVRMVWLATLVGGLFLYAALFWIVFRAHRIIETQADQLIENESLAVVGEMGSAVAHGLRNPLASIRSSAELALESELPPEARECAQDVMLQVDRLEGWVRQLLTYAKPAHANLAEVAINPLIEESIGNYARELERRGIRVTKKLAEGLPPIRADAMMLVQLLGSLIANAMEAMQSGGELRFSSRRADNSVIAELTDTGPGIRPADMNLIFKPFFTNKAKGLGLGLPLVRRVVERLGGTVEVASKLGHGTTVLLKLPV
jgi:signal transduction histidine kinase